MSGPLETELSLTTKLLERYAGKYGALQGEVSSANEKLKSILDCSNHRDAREIIGDIVADFTRVLAEIDAERQAEIARCHEVLENHKKFLANNESA